MSSMPSSDYLGKGFDEPVYTAQAWFRALMDAMSQPGTVLTMPAPEDIPDGIAPAAAGLMLTLCDADTPVFLSESLLVSRWAKTWLGFHTGAATVAQLDEAMFVYVCAADAYPGLNALAQGTPAYPDRSATLILDVSGFTDGESLALTGPGVENTRKLEVSGLPSGFLSDWHINQQRFPLGVDVILVSGEEFVGLPRSVSIRSMDVA